MVFWGSSLRSLCPRFSRMEKIGGLGIPLRSFCPTLHCRRVAGVSPLLSIGWWYLSSMSPKRHCCRVSAADKGCQVYPLDPLPDAVALYFGCTLGKRPVPGFFQMTGTLPPLLDPVVGGGTPERSCSRLLMDPMLLCPGKGLVLPNPNIDNVAKCPRFLILSLPNSEMSRKSPFVVHKAIIGIGGEPKSIQKLRSGDLLIETTSALQSKSFLLAKTFLDFPLSGTPHRSLNSCRGVISEPDLLCSSETEILEGLSDQGVTQLDTSPTTSSSQPPISKVVNKNSKRRRKHTKELKPDIEIKMSPHKPNKSYVQYTSEDEDMTVYDVEDDEHFKHIIKTGYSHLITPRKYQKK
ncbi:uncharacterized protein TNCV_486781 [Trichonephila clavipes]|nr:uncharacterized protein TNCV_486781 [Trichonephila clavipes]